MSCSNCYACEHMKIVHFWHGQYQTQTHSYLGGKKYIKSTFYAQMTFFALNKKMQIVGLSIQYIICDPSNVCRINRRREAH